MAPDAFLQEAGLDSLLLYIGPRGSYILATRDDGVLMNDAIDVHTSLQWATCNLSSGIDKRTYAARFEGINYDFFPSDQDMSLYPCAGKLVLAKKGVVYAVLYRNSELSDL
jgi:hypothetical protein